MAIYFDDAIVEDVEADNSLAKDLIILDKLFSAIVAQNNIATKAVDNTEAVLRKVWEVFFPKAIRFAACRGQLTLLHKLSEGMHYINNAEQEQLIKMAEVFTADYNCLYAQNGRLCYRAIGRSALSPLVVFDKNENTFRFYRKVTATDCAAVKSRLLLLEDFNMSARNVREAEKPKVIANENLAQAKKLASFIRSFEKTFNNGSVDTSLRTALLDYIQPRNAIAYEALKKAIAG